MAGVEQLARCGQFGFNLRHAGYECLVRCVAKGSVVVSRKLGAHGRNLLLILEILRLSVFSLKLDELVRSQHVFELLSQVINLSYVSVNLGAQSLVAFNGFGSLVLVALQCFDRLLNLNFLVAVGIVID